MDDDSSGGDDSPFPMSYAEASREARELVRLGWRRVSVVHVPGGFEVVIDIDGI